MRAVYRTRAFEFAKQRGWRLEDLAVRSGLSMYQLIALRDRKRTCGAQSIEGLSRAFPDLTFEELFYVERVRNGRTRRDRNGSEPA